MKVRPASLSETTSIITLPKKYAFDNNLVHLTVSFAPAWYKICICCQVFYFGTIGLDGLYCCNFYVPWSVIAKLLKDKLAPAQTYMHGMTICYTRQSVSTSGELTSLCSGFVTKFWYWHCPGSELCQVYQHGRTVAWGPSSGLEALNALGS